MTESNTSQAKKTAIKNICRYCNKTISRKSQSSFSGWITGFKKCKCNTSHISDAVEDDPQTYENIVKQLPEGYEFVKIRGSGGMAWLLKVRKTGENIDCALKIMKSELAENPIAKKRFELEASTVVSLQHENLVSVIAHGQTKDNAPYIVMKYESGMSLEEILKEETYLELDVALNIFVQICNGVIHAHSKGIVHRDLKPANIVINDFYGDPKVKIVDFGIAQNFEEGDDALTMTRTGELVGSPLYMSPEQCRGDIVDHRTDIYSLGCIMYEVLTGHPPFAAVSPVKVILKQMNQRPSRFKHKCKLLNIPVTVERIVFHCLEKSKDDRYQFMEEVLRDLSSIKTGTRPKVVDARLRRLKTKQVPKRQIALIASFFVALTAGYFIHVSQFDSLTALRLIFQTGFFSLGFFCSLFLVYKITTVQFELYNSAKQGLRESFGEGWLLLLMGTVSLQALYLLFYCLDSMLLVNKVKVSLLHDLCTFLLENFSANAYLAIVYLTVQVGLIIVWLYRKQKPPGEAGDDTIFW